MNFEYPQKTRDLIKKVDDFMKNIFFHMKKKYTIFIKTNPWKELSRTRKLEKTSKKRRSMEFISPLLLWRFKSRYTQFRICTLAEKMGRLTWASEVFNCSAPDTGNMETIAKYGTTEQKEKWLKPIMNGEIRSAFLNDGTCSCFIRCN